MLPQFKYGSSHVTFLWPSHLLVQQLGDFVTSASSHAPLFYWIMRSLGPGLVTVIVILVLLALIPPCVVVAACCMPDEWMTKLNYCSILSTITLPSHRLILGKSWGLVLLLSSLKIGGPVEVLVPWLAQSVGKRKTFPNETPSLKKQEDWFQESFRSPRPLYVLQLLP